MQTTTTQTTAAIAAFATTHCTLCGNVLTQAECALDMTHCSGCVYGIIGAQIERELYGPRDTGFNALTFLTDTN